MSRYKVLFCLTGSIAGYKSCYLISKLVQADVEVQTACTASAHRFIGDAALEGLTRRKNYSNVFDTAYGIEHVQLSDWYDLAITCPATGNTINKFAAGMADDPVSCLFLAHDFKKPYLIAPAMNAKMYSHPRTQESLRILGTWGVKILDADDGYQACGTEGPGRLAEPEIIFPIIMKELELHR